VLAAWEHSRRGICLLHNDSMRVSVTLFPPGRRTNSLILDANGKHILAGNWTNFGVVGQTPPLASLFKFILTRKPEAVTILSISDLTAQTILRHSLIWCREFPARSPWTMSFG
jgi:hypothetical protein